MNFKVFIWMCYPPYIVGWKYEIGLWQKQTQHKKNIHTGKAQPANVQHWTCAYALVDSDGSESSI